MQQWVGSEKGYRTRVSKWNLGTGKNVSHRLVRLWNETDYYNCCYAAAAAVVPVVSANCALLFIVSHRYDLIFVVFFSQNDTEPRRVNCNTF